MAEQLILDLLSPAPQTLHNFAGKANAHAVHALTHQGRAGRAIYLWGPSGAGRTHLLRGSCLAYGGRYFSSNSASARLKAMAMGDAPVSQLIAIDDVHALDAAGQEALFNLYNRWRESADGPSAFAIVAAGDRAPIAMPLREDLRTRLGWDLSFRLHLLTDDERAQVLQAHADTRGLPLSREVVNWLLVHYSRDMRHLIALIDALDRFSLERQRPITLPLLKDLLAQSQTNQDTE